MFKTEHEMSIQFEKFLISNFGKSYLKVPMFVSNECEV